MATKTPKQVLLEFYALYPMSHKPTFQVIGLAGATPQGGTQFKATVVCPAVERAPGDVAFNDLMFEGQGNSKRAAEHDCASKAYAHIRGIQGLQHPSTSLPVSFLTVSQHQQQQQGGFPSMVSAPMAGAAAAPVVVPSPGVHAAPHLGLTINEGAIANMGVEELQYALKEVLEQYKNLVTAVHAESQRYMSAVYALQQRQVGELHAEAERHAAELHTLISRQL